MGGGERYRAPWVRTPRTASLCERRVWGRDATGSSHTTKPAFTLRGDAGAPGAGCASPRAAMRQMATNRTITVSQAVESRIGSM